MKIEKVLIANRGEIALRVMKTCREMGIKTVAIFAEDDKGLAHTLEADESFSLGKGTLRETYLNQEKIIEIAKKTNSTGIHPGYGFLSENAIFAKLVEKNGLIFIGPTAEVIELMGDKIGSKRAVEHYQVPMIPGYHGDDQSAAFLEKKAKEIGYPVLIKASAGGGGKGMRIVEKDSDFAEALSGAKSEALKAFSNDKVLLEKYIVNPRHIEVQVFSDKHGNHLHLYERECSIQRRYQKIVEETPAPRLSQDLRLKISETAARISKGIHYLGAGTVEFILAPDGAFYFLEMNTRLQVEHPITELVIGVDLVRWQIMVAQGEKLPLSQAEIKQTGHAIECRMCAEDPDQNFMPTIGKIERVGIPSLRGSRFDSGYRDGDSIGVSYDPMLAKLIVYAETRELAIEKMQKSLDEVVFSGVKTNRDYLKRILGHKSFAKGETHTHFLKDHEKELLPKEFEGHELAPMIAAFLLREQKNEPAAHSNSIRETPWKGLSGWRIV